MQDLINQAQYLGAASIYMIPVLVLLASLLGSTHCVSMCGGIVMALPSGKVTQTGYHLGRLVGYLLLGALAGLAGDYLLRLGPWMTRVSALVIAAVMLAFAYQIWKGESVHVRLPKFMAAWVQKRLGIALQASREQPWMGFVVGGFSMFLPCGWLYTFVMGAVLTRSMWVGALFLVSFWLGTVPLLAVGPAIFTAWLKKRSQLQRQIVASLFVMAGLMTAFGKWDKSLPITAGHIQDPTTAVKMHHGHGGHQHGGHSSDAVGANTPTTEGHSAHKHGGHASH